MNTYKDELLNKMKNYDFKKMSKFAKDNEVCFKTVKKYVTELNLPYNKNKFFNYHNRNENGQFTFKNDRIKSINNNYDLQGEINQTLYIKSDLTPEEMVEKLLKSLKEK